MEIGIGVVAAVLVLPASSNNINNLVINRSNNHFD